MVGTESLPQTPDASLSDIVYEVCNIYSSAEHINTTSLHVDTAVDLVKLPIIKQISAHFGNLIVVEICGKTNTKCFLAQVVGSSDDCLLGLVWETRHFSSKC